jgi:hypothetical protein
MISPFLDLSPSYRSYQSPYGTVTGFYDTWYMTNTEIPDPHWLSHGLIVYPLIKIVRYGEEGDYIVCLQYNDTVRVSTLLEAVKVAWDYLIAPYCLLKDQ